LLVRLLEPVAPTRLAAVSIPTRGLALAATVAVARLRRTFPTRLRGGIHRLGMAFLRRRAVVRRRTSLDRPIPIAAIPVAAVAMIASIAVRPTITVPAAIPIATAIVAAAEATLVATERPLVAVGLVAAA
jgi:hypothetical protein